MNQRAEAEHNWAEHKCWEFIERKGKREESILYCLMENGN